MVENDPTQPVIQVIIPPEAIQAAMQNQQGNNGTPAQVTGATPVVIQQPAPVAPVAAQTPAPVQNEVAPTPPKQESAGAIKAENTTLKDSFNIARIIMGCVLIIIFATIIYRLSTSAFMNGTTISESRIDTVEPNGTPTYNIIDSSSPFNPNGGANSSNSIPGPSSTANDVPWGNLPSSAGSDSNVRGSNSVSNSTLPSNSTP